MYCLIYFDTEDFISSPDSPVHRLPGQMAEIMSKHGLPGCFHIHGEKARFMERHEQTDVIEAIRQHDVSLHYDRGSMHPTTAEEVSELDWFRGVDRVLYRETGGFRDLERIFGKCSALTQHGGTFAAPIVYAAGRLGKPFFYSPFRLPGREVVWFCNNLLFGGYRAPFYFDPHYRDTPQFEKSLAQVDNHIRGRAETHDLTCMFGCHPVITMMQRFPDAINFINGATPAPDAWEPPVPVEGVSIPLILENFERLVVKLAGQPNVEWTDVAGITQRYQRAPKVVADEELLRGANAVVDHGGPTYTAVLSAGELLVLLAQRAVSPSETYDVPDVIGPTEDCAASCGDTLPDLGTADALARSLLGTVLETGYLPPVVAVDSQLVSLGGALLLLACRATSRGVPAPAERQLSVDAVPGVSEALQNVAKYEKWCCHGPRYHQPGIIEPFRRQCWTLKPAYEPEDYGPGVLGLRPVG
ncbi:MAG: hypothetical protein HN742_25065 [Lentisphaerae bacterium]|mgnify:FL=1|jgi:hypothetical protein|nr:hypothetical protein [Lentisphaerota bacterium]MBT4819767.1 hypothetical protein [Lentisphaerota bacterium]MBT5607551.1 hypothetical protein [Lentisphaerota bacterium]MBT7054588.1 hypothetical protein [Lentisphaerota bacterium]MBT7845173.1 hypothetical protein [Lentisphaerota bacterium]